MLKQVVHIELQDFLMLFLSSVKWQETGERCNKSINTIGRRSTRTEVGDNHSHTFSAKLCSCVMYVYSYAVITGTILTIVHIRLICCYETEFERDKMLVGYSQSDRTFGNKAVSRNMSSCPPSHEGW
jgi:hypothetical protein